ncbi:MAG: FAD:protein FMN transferase [Pseudooceanicola sp.]|nr:FAD:protein FMN transferase [Pseudooceanicola sp.]
MPSPLTRRRFLTIASASCLAASPGLAGARFHVWEGVALGARARIVLDHPEAPRIVARAVTEIDRLESVFSLYRPQSELSRLNRHGRLARPSFEFLECLAAARAVWRLSGGRFDPTVQPLWQVLAEARQAGEAAGDAALSAARQLIGLDRVRADPGAVTLSPGQALTLNGIAQGYIADRVARMMRAEGVRDVLIDTGEIVAMGTMPRDDGPGWPVTIEGEAKPRRIAGRALATSAPGALVLDPATGQGHILDPRLGAPVTPAVAQVSVSAPSAALADALSTALCLVDDRAEAESTLRQVNGARLECFYPAAGADRENRL